MRAVIVGVASLLIAGDAYAADYLRGSSYDPPPSVGYNWSGVYGGVQWGRSQGDASYRAYDRTVATDPLLRPTPELPADLAEWRAIPGSSDRSNSYGGFVGYNAQWGDVVVGIELNYNRTGLSPNNTTRVVTDLGGGFVGITDYGARLDLTDFGSLRLRMGYAWGWVMPYAFVAAAAGRADTVRTATVTFQNGAAPAGMGPYTDTERRNNVIVFGYALGGGVDVGITSNIFLRGEYEFVQLNELSGMAMQISTFRVGAGVKF